MIRKNLGIPSENERKSWGTAMHQFWPYIIMLRLTGTHPISTTKIPKKNALPTISLGFNILSPVTIYSIVVSSGSFYMFVVMILNWAFQIYWPQKLFYMDALIFKPIRQNSTGVIVTKLYLISNCLFPFIRIVVILIQVINFIPITYHVDAMVRLYADLRQYCKNRDQILKLNIRKNIFYNFLFFVGLPWFSSVPLMAVTVATGRITPLRFSNVPVALVFFIQTFCCFWEDADLHIQCDVVTQFYHQIETIIVQTRQDLTSDSSIELIQVRVWHHFLHRNRQICRQIGKVTKIPQLLSIMTLIFNSIIYMYSVIETFALESYTSDKDILIAATGSLVFGLILLYAKAVRAECVTKTEARLNEALFSLTNYAKSPEVQLELKEMQSTMTESPIGISFGNYTKLTQGIFLTVSTQVVTYLIVLLQFEKARCP
ncbi:unnamed protein product [Allacma fusca]|uniref:Gustatory receptor n=1 Tax=Allacma fusca TaxID=39272 RepID=A0A8J2PDC5_9HEXA|nr:unnamed protein product [Allacma fusca]